jgi:hypothetical protein
MPDTAAIVARVATSIEFLPATRQAGQLLARLGELAAMDSMTRDERCEQQLLLCWVRLFNETKATRLTRDPAWEYVMKANHLGHTPQLHSAMRPWRTSFDNAWRSVQELAAA